MLIHPSKLAPDMSVAFIGYTGQFGHVLTISRIESGGTKVWLRNHRYTLLNDFPDLTWRNPYLPGGHKKTIDSVFHYFYPTTVKELRLVDVGNDLRDQTIEKIGEAAMITLTILLLDRPTFASRLADMEGALL